MNSDGCGDDGDCDCDVGCDDDCDDDDYDDDAVLCLFTSES